MLALKRLEGTRLVLIMPTLLTSLEDPDRRVRDASLEGLTKIDAATLSGHVGTLSNALMHPSVDVRRAAITLFNRLDEKVMMKHTPLFLRLYQHDGDEIVRREAKEALGRLPPPKVVEPMETRDASRTANSPGFARNLNRTFGSQAFPAGGGRAGTGVA